MAVSFKEIIITFSSFALKKQYRDIMQTVFLDSQVKYKVWS